MSKFVMINFLLYQLSWFAGVLGAANHLPWLGIQVAIAIMAWHLFKAQHARLELNLLFITLFVGGLFDQMLLSSGLITYEAHGWSQYLVPAWIISLWAGFVTLLNISLRWLRKRLFTSTLFGAIGGPLAYLAAQNLGALTINNGTTSLLTLSVGWAILTPLLVRIAQQYDGYKEVQYV